MGFLYISLIINYIGLGFDLFTVCQLPAYTSNGIQFPIGVVLNPKHKEIEIYREDTYEQRSLKLNSLLLISSCLKVTEKSICFSYLQYCVLIYFYP